MFRRQCRRERLCQSKRGYLKYPHFLPKATLTWLYVQKSPENFVTERSSNCDHLHEWSAHEMNACAMNATVIEPFLKQSTHHAGDSYSERCLWP